MRAISNPGLDYDLEACAEVTEILYATVSQYSTSMEAVSCDEVYLEANEAIRRLRCTPQELAQRIRHDFHEKTGLTVSIGIGPNRLMARMATNKAKPDGIFQVTDPKHAKEGHRFLSTKMNLVKNPTNKIVLVEKQFCLRKIFAEIFFG